MQPYTIDITDFKETGQKLTGAIQNAVRDTQGAIIRTLPDKLKMTKKQYKYLSGQPEVIKGEEPELNQQFYLYRTPMNIMEIEVSG